MQTHTHTHKDTQHVDAQRDYNVWTTSQQLCAVFRVISSLTYVHFSVIILWQFTMTLDVFIRCMFNYTLFVKPHLLNSCCTHGCKLPVALTQLLEGGIGSAIQVCFDSVESMEM